jgi:hypothetical protein
LTSTIETAARPESSRDKRERSISAGGAATGTYFKPWGGKNSPFMKKRLRAAIISGLERQLTASGNDAALHFSTISPAAHR